MVSVTLYPRVLLSNGVRRGETFVGSGDGFAPVSTLYRYRMTSKSVFRPIAGRKEEISW